MVDMHWDNDWHDNSLGPWWWLFMGLMMLVFWGGLAWLVVTLIRHGSTAHQPPSPARVNPPAQQSGPEEILHDRLARGDIDVDEYHSRIDALRAKRTE